MKIRSGFVSNSSSSSFLAIIKRDDYDKIIKSLSPIGQSLLEYVGWTKKGFAGHDCVLIYYVTGNYSSFECMDGGAVIDRAQEIADNRGVELPDDYDDEEQRADFLYEDLYQILDKFKEQIAVLEKKGEAITHGEYL